MKPMTIGKLYKPFGLKGTLRAAFYVDDLEELKAFSAFYIRDAKAPGGYKPLAIENLWERQGNVFIDLTDAPDRTSAELLQGQDIFADEAEVPELTGSSYYIKDLIGCETIEESGLSGEIKNVFEIANRTLFLVKLTDGRELAVPFNDDYVTEVNIHDRTIRMKNWADLL